MIYLASPYSHPSPFVRDRRFHDACRAMAMLLRNNCTVFSPIIHSHPLVSHGLPTDWAFWKRHDREHLLRCDEVLVLKLDGWLESVGVQEEIRIAKELGKPVRFLDIVPEKEAKHEPTP